MLNLRDVYKPRTIDDALALLKQPGTVALAGGTQLIAGERKDVRAVVDLSELGLAYIREQDGTAAIGATTLLAELEDSPLLRSLANGVAAEAAHRSAASLLRNQGTVAGTLLSDPAGILATCLSALQARVRVLSPARAAGADGIALDEFLARREELIQGALVTEIFIPNILAGTRAALEMVARTPRDKPIVSVCAAVQVRNGKIQSAAIALGGVSELVRRAAAAEKRLLGQAPGVELSEQAAEKTAEGLNPPSDFRGSAEYRREMARVLTARALKNCLKTE